jgi:hypothetical protein
VSAFEIGFESWNIVKLEKNIGEAVKRDVLILMGEP